MTDWGLPWEEADRIIEWIIAVGSNPLVSSLSSLCGIAGLVFSVVIWLRTNDLKAQLGFYKRNQKKIASNLTSYRDSIIRDGLYTLHIRSQIRTELYSILQEYRSLLSPLVKWRILWAIHVLNSNRGELSPKKQEKLCTLLDWIIARIQRKENR